MIKQIVDEYLKFENKFKTESSFYTKLKAGKLPLAALVSYLEDITYLVAYTETALQNAEKQAKEQKNQDMAAFFLDKYHEEKGHKVWGLEDTKLLASKNNIELRNGPSPGGLKMRKIVDDLIGGDPVNYLAYIYFAEKITIRFGPELLALAKSGLGIASGEMSIISNHVELDKEHNEENERMLDLFLSSENFEPFLGSMKKVMAQYMTMLDGSV